MIVSIGESVIDFKGQDYYVGGCPLNTAIAVARLGSTVAYLSDISSDTWGKQITAVLKDNGIIFDRSLCNAKASTMTSIAKCVDGVNTYTFKSKGTTAFSFSEEKLSNFFSVNRNINCIFLGSVSLIDPVSRINIINAVRKLSEPCLFFDPNIRENLIEDKEDYFKFITSFAAECDIVKVSDDDLSSWGLTEEQLLEKCKENLIITRGSQGSTWYVKNKFRVDCKAFKPKHAIIDTIGCGDTFNGALLSWLDKRDKFENLKLSETEIRLALEFAGECAACNCTREGCNPPYDSEVFQ